MTIGLTIRSALLAVSAGPRLREMMAEGKDLASNRLRTSARTDLTPRSASYGAFGGHESRYVTIVNIAPSTEITEPFYKNSSNIT